MQITGIGNGVNAVQLKAGIKPEEAAEIRNGTTEEGAKALDAFKSAEQERGIGRNVDIKG